MKRKLFFITSLTLLSFVGSFVFFNKKSKPSQEIVVTTAPYKHFAERLTTHQIPIHCLVPQESDPHTYEPSAKEMMRIFNAKVWFLSGEPFEGKLKSVVLKNNPQISIIDLTENIPALKGHCCSHHHSKDLHFWLSPAIAQTQVNKMALELQKLYPEQKQYIEKQNDGLNIEFDRLNLRLGNLLKGKKDSFFLVSHPAFSYFAKQYQLNQLSLEEDGADPSPKALTELISQVQDHQIDTLYIQKQYHQKAAEQFAHTQHLNLIEINPYHELYFDNLTLFAEHLSR